MWSLQILKKKVLGRMHLRALFLLRASSNSFCSCPQGFWCQQCLQAAVTSTGAYQKRRCHNSIL